MAQSNEEKKYIKAMGEWGKEVAKWQLAHPDKDWLTELTNPVIADAEGGGDRPPQPPIKP